MLDLNKYTKSINELCEKYEVAKLTLFGSALRDDFNAESDVDFLLEFKYDKESLQNYMGLKRKLESTFNRKVDLIMPERITNELLLKYIYAQTLDVYAA